MPYANLLKPPIVGSMATETVYANALNHIPELGATPLRKLRMQFGSYEAAWRAHKHKAAFVDPATEYAQAKEQGIRLILEDDAAYPPLLRTIHSPPAGLYVTGTLHHAAMPALAVVGTRTPTAYGREACKMLVGPLAAAGVPIVSGLARGIDTKAHEAALEENGYTVAVLGSGLSTDVVYPAANKTLARAIAAKNGAVISEYPPGHKAAAWTFPQRNRIIAGLTAAVLVIEAREQSGTRITARLAAEFGRDVFALPGPVFSAHSWTPHHLIKEGAALVTSADDIFYALGIQPARAASPKPVTPEEETILGCLDQPLSANDIARTRRISIHTVQHTLALLEIRGIVKNMGNGLYRKTV